MGYDDGLAQRVRQQLEGEPDLVEREMFGGIAFMVAGNMACGVIEDALIVRVGGDNYDSALEEPGARPFDFTGRPMKGWVQIEGEPLADDDRLASWVDKGRGTARSLPPK